MSKKEVVTTQRPDTSRAPFSLGIECDGWVYVSGQGPLDLATGEIKRGTIEEETRVTLENIRIVLEAAGCTFDDVVKCTCYLSDIANFDAFSRTYREHFAHPRPARTTVEAKLWSGILVEIDAVARKPK